MRWIPFILIAYMVVLLQTSVTGLLMFSAGSIGSVGPDLLAMLAVFVAITARQSVEVMLAAWVLGFAADLTAGGGAGAVTAIGPMSISYVLAAGMVFQVREAFFRERTFTKVMLVLAFCLLAHPMWVTLQTLRSIGAMSWGDYGRLLLQALLLSAYTAVLAPFAFFVFSRMGGLILASQSSRQRRSHR